MLLFLEYDGDPVQDIEFEPSEELLSGELHELAEKLGVKPFEAFLSANEEEYDEVETQWFDPEEGIKTVGVLLAELQKDDNEQDQWVIGDLRKLLTALQILQKSGSQFYLTME
jgi:hypothetical protein